MKKLLCFFMAVVCMSLAGGCYYEAYQPAVVYPCEPQAQVVYVPSGPVIYTPQPRVYYYAPPPPPPSFYFRFDSGHRYGGGHGGHHR